MNATISERGNGFPSAGDYVPGDDGELYQVLSIGSRIHTEPGGSGGANWVTAQVELADWSDCDNSAEFPALCVLESEPPP